MKTSTTNFLVLRLGTTLNTSLANAQIVSITSRNSTLPAEFFIYCAYFQSFYFTQQLIVVNAIINSTKINLYLCKSPWKIRGAPI